MVEGWEKKKLGDIAEIRMCKRVFADQTTPTGEIPFYKIGTFGKEPDAFISRELYEEYRSKYSFPSKGDILLSAAGTLGRTVVYDGKPAYYQDSNIVWLDIDHGQVSNDYLFHYYKTIKWASPEGSTISRLYNQIIYETEVLLPPLHEQRTITEALSDMDGNISVLEKLIEKKHNIKYGAIQDLLAGKRRLPGFKGDWNRVLLGDVSEALKGSGLSKSKVSDDGKYKCILYGELFTIYSVVIRSVFSRTDYNEGVKSKSGDVLIPGSTTTKGIDLARASTLSFDNVLLGGDINIIRPDSSKINSIFLSYYISNIAKDEISRRSKGVTIYHIHGNDLKDLDLFIPSSIEEQGVIAEILNQMDSELETLELKLTKLKMIKQGMMQELLTGRIRLVTDSENMPATNSKPVF